MFTVRPGTIGRFRPRLTLAQVGLRLVGAERADHTLLNKRL